MCCGPAILMRPAPTTTSPRCAPGSPATGGVAHASRNADTLRNTGAGALAAGTGADAADKLGEDAGIEPYNDAKNHFTKEVGSTW